MNEISNECKGGGTECVICYNQIVSDAHVTCSVCSHTVCNGCFIQLQRRRCPMCRTRYPGVMDDHPILGAVDNARFSLILMELLLLYEQRRILNQCRTIWDLHLRYLRRTVGLGDIAVMIMIGETDLILGRVAQAIRHVDQSIEDLYSTMLDSGGEEAQSNQ